MKRRSVSARAQRAVRNVYVGKRVLAPHAALPANRLMPPLCYAMPLMLLPLLHITPVCPCLMLHDVARDDVTPCFHYADAAAMLMMPPAMLTLHAAAHAAARP